MCVKQIENESQLENKIPVKFFVFRANIIYCERPELCVILFHVHKQILR